MSREELSRRVLRGPSDKLWTGVVDRTGLLACIRQAVSRSQQSTTIVAVLFAGIDGFGAVMNEHGSRAGNVLLGAAAGRVTGLLRPGDTLAYLGDAEFVVWCEDLDDMSAAGSLATRMGRALNGTFVLFDTKVVISATVGVAFAGQGEDLPAEILRDPGTVFGQARGEQSRRLLVDLTVETETRGSDTFPPGR